MIERGRGILEGTAIDLGSLAALRPRAASVHCLRRGVRRLDERLVARIGLHPIQARVSL
jgi:hypothetical protein